MVGGQLARRYNLPYRSSNVCAANAVDAQAAYESVFSLWGAVMGGVNMLMHGAGWMEGGLHASLEKMVLDADLLQMVAAMIDPVVVDDDTLAIDAIDEVGPGGHFFGVGHTQERYRTAFYNPMISDWRNYESWDEAGSPRPPAGPTPSPRRSSPPTSRLRWTPPSARSSKPSSPAGSPRAASPPISDNGTRPQRAAR